MERSTDREKVIKGLEQIIWEVDNNSMWLPGDDDIRDAITLLKEQEKEINYLKKILLPESGHENDKDELPS